MALFSRRIALLAASTATAVLGSLAMPATMAQAADPISGTPAPTLSDPTDTHRVVLKWTPSATSLPYATGYELQISPNGDWTNNTVTLPNGGVTSNTSYEVPISLPHASYFWRVRAVDAAGHTGWSTVHTFLREWDVAMQLLKEPTTADPSIVWAPVPGASLYRVRYSVFSNFDPNPSKTAVCWTAATSFTPYTLQSNGEKISGDCMKSTDIEAGTPVYWDVRAWDDSSAPTLTADTANDPNFDCATAQPECDASELNSVALAANDAVAASTFVWPDTSAGTPVVSGPITGSTTWHDANGSHACNSTTPCPVTPTFSWDAVPGANWYEVDVWRDPSLSNVYRSYFTAWPSLTPRDDFFDAQANNAYYWRVVAGTCVNSDSDAKCGNPIVTKGTTSGGGGGGSAGPLIFTPYTSTSVMTFDKRSGTVTATSPANDSLTNGATGTFKWTDFFVNGGQSALDVRNYRVQIATDNQFDDVVLDVPTIDDVQFTPQVAQLADGDYYWRVQPVDESGNGLTWSNVMHFKRDATPPVFTLTDGSNLPLAGTKFHVTVGEALNVADPTGHFTIVSVVGTPVTLGGVWAAQADGRSWVFTSASKLMPGQSYALHLSPGVADAANNPAKVATHTARASVIADDKSGVWTFPSGAARHSASGALGGTHVTLPSTKSATLRFVGTKVYVYGCKAPSLAKLVIALDGRTLTTVSEHLSYTKCGVLLYSGSASTGVIHTLKVTASGGTASIDQARTA